MTEQIKISKTGKIIKFPSQSTLKKERKEDREELKTNIMICVLTDIVNYLEQLTNKETLDYYQILWRFEPIKPLDEKLAFIREDITNLIDIINAEINYIKGE
jgi:hypothetical protein